MFKIFGSLLFCLGLGWGAGAFEVPRLTGPVVDEAGFLSAQAKAELIQDLAALNQKGGPQIQVVTLLSLQGEPIESAAIKIADQWKIGNAQRDDGVILLISREERRMRIEVGQGLEGALPDVIAKRIVDLVIKPQFKKGDMDQGILQGVSAIVSTVIPEYEGKLKTPALAEPKIALSDLFVWGFFLFFMFFGFLGRLAGGRRGLRGGVHTWGGGLGGGGFSGGGGGGWSGGGGGFSGGGASGDW